VNIVETVDLVQDESKRWCEVMEFCPGGDLYAAIRRGRMSPSEVECCFKQILTGVAYLHSQGVAHRDIKPENLFFDLQGHLKVVELRDSRVHLALTPFPDRRLRGFHRIQIALGEHGPHVHWLMWERTIHCP
jgi:serine/threonine protein kinase